MVHGMWQPEGTITMLQKIQPELTVPSKRRTHIKPDHDFLVLYEILPTSEMSRTRERIFEPCLNCSLLIMQAEKFKTFLEM